MKAGSSPGIGKSGLKGFAIPITEPPVVEIEIVGQQEFSIRELIKQVPVKVTNAVLNQTRYVAADLQVA
jgi:hypothetical protein